MDVLMPQLGETVAEGKITKWFKSAGDAVKPGDNLFEIETDKVSMEVPSITAGTLSRDQRAGRRDGAGRRRGRGDRGRGRRGASSAPAAAAPCQGAAANSVSSPRKREPRAKDWVPASAGTNGQQRCASFAYADLDPFFEVRTPVAQFRPGQNLGRHVRHAAGAPSRRRERHRSVAHVGLGPARPHRRRRRRIRHRQRAAAAPRRRRPACRPRRSRRSIRASSSRRCRSTACARPSRARLVEAKQTIPHFYLVADVTMDALLKIREEANAGAPKDVATSFRSTISSSRRWRSRCSASRPPTRCGPATASCASSIPMSASRSRSTADC